MGIHDDYEFIKNIFYYLVPILCYNKRTFKNICVHPYKAHSELINYYMTSVVILKLNKLILCASTPNFSGIQI